DAHASGNVVVRGGRWLAGRFNAGFDHASNGYAGTVAAVARRRIIMLAIYAGLLAGTVYMANIVPRGFIPLLDQGYAIVVIQLPDGASLSRTDAVVRKASKIIEDTPGVIDAVAFAGFSGATFTNASNAAAIFARFAPFEERLRHGQSGSAVIGQLFARLQSIEQAFIIAIPPPPVRGIGSAGGFKIELQERLDAGMLRVLAAAREMMARARTMPELTGVFTTFSASSPQIYLEIDRTKARMLDVPIANIFETLQDNLGIAYVNDFNAFGRVYQVRA